MYYQSITDCRFMDTARRSVLYNFALAIPALPLFPLLSTYPWQIIAKMRPLRRAITLLRCFIAFVDVKYRLPLLVQRSPIRQTPGPHAKTVRPLILHNSWSTFRRFSAKKRQLSHSILFVTKG